MESKTPDDARAFRDTLGAFATGVTVVTLAGVDGEDPIGVTVSSFNSVSLDPPLVLFSIDKSSYSLPYFESATHYAVNVLAEDQEAVSNRFALSSSDKWRGIDFEIWETGAPVLENTLAVFECAAHHQYDGGDHVIFVGRVLRMASLPDARPLLYVRGHYTRLAD